ncbi:MAG: sec-independent protein translocase protein TatA [Pyrinomonadaceae bacterium]|jgi:TatA/E family protein of Tat protein translocase|nr:sec-independent protein translocase protein TatA [Pyrinomonadaceae bacterium]
MFFLFLESLGTTELLVILVVALVLFGPRKLPELSRSLGKSLNEFKRAGDEFKRTWEREVALESVEREAAVDRAMVADTPDAAQVTSGVNDAANAQPHDITEAAFAPVQGANVARGARVETAAAATFDDDNAAPQTEATGMTEATEVATAEQQQQSQPSRKTDWL